MLRRGRGDSWALGEPPLGRGGGGVVGRECGRPGGGEGRGGVGGGGRGRGFRNALSLLEGHEAVGLGAAPLLLRDLHGLRPPLVVALRVERDGVWLRGE